ncbi:MAG: hypothetical protein AB7U62_03095 [Pseudolabrys sp.]
MPAPATAAPFRIKRLPAEPLPERLGLLWLRKTIDEVPDPIVNKAVVAWAAIKFLAHLMHRRAGEAGCDVGRNYDLVWPIPINLSRREFPFAAHVAAP